APLRLSRPSSVQHVTRSPGTPMTRLTDAVVGVGPRSRVPSKTTRSPRSTVVVLSTTSRSPSRSVGSMESEVPVKVSTTKKRRSTSASTATPAATSRGRRGERGSSVCCSGLWVTGSAGSARRGVALLLDLGGLAAQTTEVVELGAADVTTGDDLDL